MHDLRFPLRFKSELPSFGMLRCVPADLDLRSIPDNQNLALYEDTLLREQNTITAVYCTALQFFPKTPTKVFWAHC